MPTTIQQKLVLPALSTSQCRTKLFDFIPRSDQICAGGEDGKDSCSVSFSAESDYAYFLQGDSGGPLLMRYIIPQERKSAYHENSKPWYVLGITSFGTRRCSGGYYPGIYTRYILVYFQHLMDLSIITNPSE